jgi:adenine-specific DNA-methyltransferase
MPTSTDTIPAPHLAFEGDNLPILESLITEHEGGIDLIYIDPPYNTGNTTRKYQDAYRDWQLMMEQRLQLAQDLLSETGVIVVAIDDAEHHNLRVLMDAIFGRENYLSTLVWQGGITNNARFGGGGLDYMVCYGRNRKALIAADVRWREPKPGVDTILAAGRDCWDASGHDPAVATDLLRTWWRTHEHDFAPGMHEYSRIDELGRVFRIAYLGMPPGRGSGRYDVLHPTTGKPVKLPPGDWNCNPTTMAGYISDGRVLFGPDEATIPHRKLFLTEQSTQAPLPSFSQRRDAGTNHLEDLLGEHRFSNPKDHLVLARWFKMMAPNNATILDFFAGSGTTAEAVIHLNREDGGTRRFIVITNNEVSASDAKRLRAAGHQPGDDTWEAEGVFRKVLEPRIRAVVSGLRPDGTRHGPAGNEVVEFRRRI